MFIFFSVRNSKNTKINVQIWAKRAVKSYVSKMFGLFVLGHFDGFYSV